MNSQNSNKCQNCKSKDTCNSCKSNGNGSANSSNGSLISLNNFKSVGNVKSLLYKLKNLFMGLTIQERVHLGITVLFSLSALLFPALYLRPFNIPRNAAVISVSFIAQVDIYIRYIIFRAIMKELQKNGYHKLAWVVAFQPIIDMVLLTVLRVSLGLFLILFVLRFSRMRK